MTSVKHFLVVVLTFLLIAVPILGQLTLNVHAIDNTESVTRDDMVDAFKAYCKSRDLTIDGSILDAVDNFTSDAFQKICNTIGIDITALQAEINKIVDPTSNSLKYFAFTATGINGFNRIFAQLLQDNDLAVGDENVDKTVYSGDWWEDDNGKGCFLYYINLSPGSSNVLYSSHDVNKSNITKYGTFIYNSGALIDMTSGVNSFNNLSFTVNGVNYSGNLSSANANSNGLGYSYINRSYAGQNRNILTAYDRYWTFDCPGTDTYGGCSVYKFSNGKYGIGFIGINAGWTVVDTNVFNIRCYILPSDQTTTPTDINVKSPVIKPELPDEPTNIAPDGNYTPTDQDPTEPPPDPTGGTPPDWGMDTDVEPDGDGWKIPFSLPDLDIDWSIQGLQNKFPLSIPFDLYKLCMVLNAQPQTPEIIGTVDLKIFQWEIDWDFHDFDGLARILRAMELLLFVIGLAVITRTIIKG